MGNNYRSNEEEAGDKIKLMKNFWNILAMCSVSCFITMFLSVITAMIKGMIILKMFLYAVILIMAIFSIITLVTTGMSIYFKVTTLSEEKFKKAVAEIAETFQNA